MTDVVLLETSDGVAIVTLNRPAARNALSKELVRRLTDVLTEAETRPDIAAIIITGTDPAFCAGVDLREIAAQGLGRLAPLDDGPEAPASPGSGAATARTRRGPFPTLTKPLIGAINGAAVTGGLELALNCDFLVASERATFGDTHARVGVMPGWGLTVLLPQAIGVRRAREMSFTGNFLSADDALAWGLVNHVVAHDDLLPFTRRLAGDIVGISPTAVQRMRRTYDEVTDDDDGWQAEQRVSLDWQRTMFDREHVARQRASIIDRGRTQQAG